MYWASNVHLFLYRTCTCRSSIPEAHEGSCDSNNRGLWLPPPQHTVRFQEGGTNSIIHSKYSHPGLVLSINGPREKFLPDAHITKDTTVMDHVSRNLSSSQLQSVQAAEQSDWMTHRLANSVFQPVSCSFNNSPQSETEVCFAALQA
jgi:hypothetical protein